MTIDQLNIAGGFLAGLQTIQTGKNARPEVIAMDRLV